jgi:hypothetical protein
LAAIANVTGLPPFAAVLQIADLLVRKHFSKKEKTAMEV